MILIREKPPTRLSVNIETPSGFHARWGADDPRPTYQPQGLTFGTAMPGGFSTGACTLERDPRKTYPDIEELSKFTVAGVGGQTAWEGRIEELPDVGGNQSQLSPQCSGFQSHLKDYDGAREIFLDCALSDWQGASVQRQLTLLGYPVDETDASNSPDQSTGQPALVTQITGPWSRQSVSEGWYDAKGIPIGTLYWAWKRSGSIDSSDANWTWTPFLCTDDVGTADDTPGSQRGAGPSTGSMSASAANRTWAMVQLSYAVAAGGNGVNYGVYWTYLGVVGRHGCPIQGVLGDTGGLGILASDAIAYGLGKWAPKIGFTTGSSGTIQPTTFAIPQLVFSDPTDLATMIAQMVQYELSDWAVWEGPTFYLNPRGESPKTRTWRSRVRPAQLQEAGPSTTRLYNGCIVQFTDVTGIMRVVGPPGSGAPVTDASLLDSDPLNPCNQAGIDRWIRLQMGTTTPAAAIQVGARYLQEHKLLDTSGQASLTGHVQDDHGVWWPAWMVRAGDTISFVDASDPSPRRIVSTNYTHQQRTNAVQLDQPPQTVEALLQRLSAAVEPVGFS